MKELEQYAVPFYMYDDAQDQFSLASIKPGTDPWSRKVRGRYISEIANDQQMIAALEKSPLRTSNHTEAKLFIPPIQFGSLMTAAKGSEDIFNTAMRRLLNHEIFKKHQGHNHLLISTVYGYFRQDKVGDFNKMNYFYHHIYNTTAILCWDPSASWNDMHDDSKNASSVWNEFYEPMHKIQPLTARSASVAFGMNNSAAELIPATMEKFRNASNFIFYHSRPTFSWNNSTIYRHAPITNITQDDNGTNFPKSSIGFDISKDQWLRDYKDSKFCLVIRGDTPGSHALWRSIRMGCIPVIACDTLPVWGPILKSTINMTDYGIMISERDMVNDPTSTLLKLKELSDAEIETKIKHLAYAQRVTFTDHPDSLFVPALLKEAQMASTVKW